MMVMMMMMMMITIRTDDIPVAAARLGADKVIQKKITMVTMTTMMLLLLLLLMVPIMWRVFVTRLRIWYRSSCTDCDYAHDDEDKDDDDSDKVLGIEEGVKFCKCNTQINCHENYITILCFQMFQTFHMLTLRGIGLSSNHIQIFPMRITAFCLANQHRTFASVHQNTRNPDIVGPRGYLSVLLRVTFTSLSVPKDYSNL